jgi:hypothetical protein
VRLVPLHFLRVLVGVLGAFFAYALGRAVMRLHRQGRPLARAVTWALRVTVCLFAVLWVGGLDAIGIAILAAASLCLALGVYLEWRPKHTEEIHLFKE